MFKLQSIWKYFPEQDRADAALKDISIDISKGSSVAIVGRSGSGKSTLINIMSALIRPTEGEYIFNGQKICATKVNDHHTVWLRRQTGYISQSSDLLNNFNVFENINLAAKCRDMVLTEEEIKEWLKKVGLENKAKELPSKLSGGQRQRVNIARALACKPHAVFADEPTGALDVYTAQGIIDLLVELSSGESQTTLLLVTHSPEAAACCNRQLCLQDGSLLQDCQGLTSGQIESFIKQGAL